MLSTTKSNGSDEKTLFAMLMYLENTLDSDTFDKVKSEIESKASIGNLLNFDGQSAPATYQNLKRASYFDLPPDSLLKVNREYDRLLGSKPYFKFPRDPSTSFHNTKSRALTNNSQNFLQNQATHILTNSIFPSIYKQRAFKHSITRFKRMKSIFAHANLTESAGSTISCLAIDKTGKFLITGADDHLIKIWQLNTGLLQASLHGHKAVIIDLALSPCGNFISSGSKDGEVIVWDLRTFTFQHQFSNHADSIANIKFFEVSAQSIDQRPLQLMITCARDGVLMIYNAAQLGSKPIAGNDHGGIGGPDQQQDLKKSKHIQSIRLDYNKSRNGKSQRIQSFSFSHKGLLAAGCESGEILLWQMRRSDIENFRMTSNPPLLCQEKIHKKEIHHLDFSNDGGYLFSGSVDGSAKLFWFGEDCFTARDHIQMDSRMVEKIDDYKNKSQTQCDNLTWSVKSRYAIAGISGKPKISTDNNQEMSVIKVFDTFKQEITHSLGSYDASQTGKQEALEFFTFVLTPHPKVENILLSGGGSGKIVIWDIEAGVPLQKFIETGVYTLDPYVFHDIFDGKFTPDGLSFAIATLLGSISIYSVFSDETYKATPVQQFLNLDDAPRGVDAYENTDRRVMLCNLDMIPHVQQPQFLRYNLETSLTPEQYAKSLKDRVRDCQNEENYFMHEEAQAMDTPIIQNIQTYNRPVYQNDALVIPNRMSQESRVSINLQNGGSNRIGSPENDQIDTSVPVQNGMSTSMPQRSSRRIATTAQRLATQAAQNSQVAQTSVEESKRQSSRGSAMSDLHDSDEEFKMGSQAVNTSLSREARRRERNRKRGYQVSEEDEDDDEDQEMYDSDDYNLIDSRSGRSSLRRKSQASMEEGPVKTRSGKQREESNKAQDQMNQQRRGGSRGRNRRVIEESEDDQNLNLEESDYYVSDEDAERTAAINRRSLPLSQSLMGTQVEDEGLTCAFCCRGGLQLEGPFKKMKLFINENGKNEFYDKEISNKQFWFHKDCLEFNDVVKLNSDVHQYTKVKRAIKKFIFEEGERICERCKEGGAVVTCQQCPKTFHGHLCARPSLVASGDGFVCYSCINDLYQRRIKITPKQIQDHSKVLRQALRSHFYKKTPQPIGSDYIPQIHDQVYYFWQGHEAFINKLHLYYFTGQPDTQLYQLPWIQFPELMKPTLCKIVNLQYEFPCERTTELVKRFGHIDNLEVQIQINIELEIVSETPELNQIEEPKKFQIILMKHEEPEFLVLKNHFEMSLSAYQKRKSDGAIKDKRFRTFIHDIPHLFVISDGKKEAHFTHQTYWETIEYCQDNNYIRRGHIKKDEDIGRISIWEVIWDDTQDSVYSQEDLRLRGLQGQLKSSIHNYIEKKPKLVRDFLNEITPQIASNYYEVIPVQSYLKLIEDRLRNRYYRNFEQIIFELNLIYDNCSAYNTPQSPYSKQAKQIVKDLIKDFTAIESTYDIQNDSKLQDLLEKERKEKEEIEARREQREKLKQTKEEQDMEEDRSVRPIKQRPQSKSERPSVIPERFSTRLRAPSTCANPNVRISDMSDPNQPVQISVLKSSIDCEQSGQMEQSNSGVRKRQRLSEGSEAHYEGLEGWASNEEIKEEQESQEEEEFRIGNEVQMVGRPRRHQQAVNYDETLFSSEKKSDQPGRSSVRNRQSVKSYKEEGSDSEGSERIAQGRSQRSSRNGASNGKSTPVGMGRPGVQENSGLRRSSRR